MDWPMLLAPGFLKWSAGWSPSTIFNIAWATCFFFFTRSKQVNFSQFASSTSTASCWPANRLIINQNCLTSSHANHKSSSPWSSPLSPKAKSSLWRRPKITSCTFMSRKQSSSWTLRRARCRRAESLKVLHSPPPRRQSSGPWQGHCSGWWPVKLGQV